MYIQVISIKVDIKDCRVLISVSLKPDIAHGIVTEARVFKVDVRERGSVEMDGAKR